MISLSTADSRYTTTYCAGKNGGFRLTLIYQRVRDRDGAMMALVEEQMDFFEVCLLGTLFFQ